MMNYPRTHFVATDLYPYGLARRVQRETTVFHPDGSRTVTGNLGTVRYDADGTATFLGRMDLAA